jgi:hypothetical protein
MVQEWTTDDLRTRTYDQHNNVTDAHSIGYSFRLADT